MKKMKKGQTMVEYILIVSLIAIAVIAAVKIFSEKLSDKFEEAGDAVEEAGN
jgi:Flp pilus assembly pilin Flp